MWVSIFDPFIINCGTDKCLNQSDYPWNIPCTLPFFHYACISPLCTKFSPSSDNGRYSADMAQMNRLKRRYAYDSALSTINLAAAS